jgi:hypothetical protein
MMKDFLWLIDEGRHWIDLWAAEGITAKTLYADNIGIPPEGLTTLAKACPIDLEWLDTDHWPTDEGIIENTLELGFFWENPGLFPAALGTTVRYCSHDDCYTFIETTVAAVVESLVEHFVLRFAATAAEAEPPPLSPTSRAALMDMAAEGITLENVTVVSPQAWSLSLARGSSNSYVCSTCDVSSERMTISL